MPKRIYVGSLPFSASDDEIRSLFGDFGTVVKVKISPNPARDPSYVEMDDSVDVKAIIAKLNDTAFKGSKLKLTI